jgi:hypothetical protein
VLNALALISMVASISLSVYVLLPKSGFVFSLSGPGMYEQLYPFREDEAEVRRRLIYWLDGYWRTNQERIDRLGRYYLAATIALMLQLVLWSWALADTIS